MPNLYEVTVYETWARGYTVQADSEEEAEQLARECAEDCAKADFFTCVEIGDVYTFKVEGE
jgi:hypothetical protein